MIQVKQSAQFERIYKKLTKHHLKLVNEAIQAIVESPEIGEMKKGDLQGVRVYKFRVHKLLYLLAYEWDGVELIILLVIGVHENFYRDLKNSR